MSPKGWHLSKRIWRHINLRSKLKYSSQRDTLPKRADSTASTDPSSRKINQHFMNREYWIVTDIHLCALYMSFNFLSLVLVKVFEKSCCSEKLFSMLGGHKICIDPEDIDFVFCFSHFLIVRPWGNF